MQWVKDVNTFYNFLGYVVLRAPDRWPVEDFLEPHQQMTLEKAFIELRHGLEITGAVGQPGQPSNAEHLLEASLAAYLSGDRKKGAHLLQDMEATIFKK